MYYFQNKENRTVKVQADDPISFIQLISKADSGMGEVRGLYQILNKPRLIQYVNRSDL